jgi:DNA-directed RNA polymerase specialized sigma subunit
VAVRIVLSTLAWLAIDAFMRGMARAALEREEVVQRLRTELGRPPWPEEVDRELGIDHLR